MKTIKLFGEIAKDYKDEWQLEVATPGDNGIHLRKQAIHLAKPQKFKNLLLADKNIFMLFQLLACF